MNSILKTLVKRRPISLIQVTQRFIFDEKFLKIDRFRDEQTKMKQKYIQTKETIEKNVVYQLKHSGQNVNVTNIKKLLRLSSTSQDIEFLVDILKKFIQKNVLSTNEVRGLVIQLVRLIYIVDRIDIALKFYDDEILAPYVSGSYASLIIMNKLLINKQYDLLLGIFEKQLEDYSIDVSFSINSTEDFRQSIPFDQLDCVAEALLYMNTKESIEKLKLLLNTLEDKKSNLGRRAVARLFLLCINQNEPQLALELVHKFAFSIDLRLNLEIIALCHLGKISNAFVLANEMFNITSYEEQKYSGKFFPLVLKTFDEQIEKKNKSDFLYKLKILKEDIHTCKRLSNYDLIDYCYNKK